MRRSRSIVMTLACAWAAACTSPSGPVGDHTVPPPLVDDTSATGPQTAVLAGGCFWSMEAVFEHVRGVVEVVSGYSGGTAEDAHYDLVVHHLTDHAEVVRIVFDPAQVTFGQLLRVYFSVAHDPTQVDRQGPDVGRHYRSDIFAVDGGQGAVAQAYIDQLEVAGVFDAPIATRVDPLWSFFPAEEEHQDFVARHPDDDYVVLYSLPKVARLEALFPELYVP